MEGRTRTLILGAAGRDFHNFNVVYREDGSHEVIAFTATQIPGIDDKRYPAELAGDLYPKGIPIVPQEQLGELIVSEKIDLCVMSHSDVPDDYVMALASMVNAAGASFSMLGTRLTMIPSERPVVAVCAVRTGCGKSQTTRRVAEILTGEGLRVVVIRHPMPYGNLVAQRVQRFEKIEDLAKQKCTIEEMEEYEPHIRRGTVVYAGVDYAEILRRAEKEADVILWDGGNNDTSFFVPDILLTVVDPHRPGDEISYYPGQTNLRMADVVIINKIDSAYPEHVAEVRANVRAVNPEATIIEAASPVTVDRPELVEGRTVLIVEDGPTLTHGEMSFGAGYVAAEKYGAAGYVDPREYAVGTIAETYDEYYADEEDVLVLPAMGYGKQQIADLEETIEACECDTVVIATPVDLTRLIRISKPTVRVGYDLQVIGRPNLEDLLRGRFTRG
ncbi:hypothetical protein JW921_08255 [Candidatus Fermentibacterales bacterium]|nr:hypothetical protein [Candidatus Fermentibacterales bacterium]